MWPIPIVLSLGAKRSVSIRFIQPYSRITFLRVFVAVAALGTACKKNPIGGPEAQLAIDSADTDPNDPTNPDPSQNPNGTCGKPVGAAPLRRLTKNEIQRSISSVFGVQASVEDLPPDPLNDGFDNDASQLAVTLAHGRAYQALAETVASEIVASNALRERWTANCSALADDCFPAVVERVGRLVFRRALSANEKNAIVTLANSAKDSAKPYDALSIVIEALLQSPEFLFRFESKASVSDKAGYEKLDDTTIANRLAFFLWQEAPSEAMLLRAETSGYPDAQAIEEEALQMLDDPRSVEARRTFARGWLRLADLGQRGFDGEFSRIAEEALLHQVEDHFAASSSALELYRSGTVWVNEQLAQIYGLEGVTGAEIRPVQLPPESPRDGLFGTAAFAMLTSHPSATSIVHRGKYVRDVALCDPISPPPAGVDTSLMPGESELSAVDRRRSNELCYSCHKKMDGIGVGLEGLGPLGEFRTAYEDGRPIPTSGYVDVDGDPAEDFVGVRALGERVGQSEWARSCLTRKYFRWMIGRAESNGDRCTSEAAIESFQASGDEFRALVLALVRSDSFRYRPAQEVCTE